MAKKVNPDFLATLIVGWFCVLSSFRATPLTPESSGFFPGFFCRGYMVYSVDDICNELKISRSTFYRFIKPKIEKYKIVWSCRTVRYRSECLEQIMKGEN